MERTAEQVTAEKMAAGFYAADLVEDGMVIGLGTGSTVFYMIDHLSRRVRDGLKIAGVPTSYQTAIRAREHGIPLTTLDDNPVLDLAIDGADQVDPHLFLIKGRGAAQTREKCVAEAALQFVVVVDEEKVVKSLSGTVPVEVLPFGVKPAMAQLAGLGCIPKIREGVKKDGPVISDNGNFIVDCLFRDVIQKPREVEEAMARIPGVVESGLFTGYAEKTTVVVGNKKRCKVITSADLSAKS